MAMSRANMNQQITKPGQQKKVGTVMREFKKGQLHSGKGGPVVKNPKQAIAIALSEARKVKKSEGGMVESDMESEYESEPMISIEISSGNGMRSGGMTGRDGCAVRGKTKGRVV